MVARRLSLIGMTAFCLGCLQTAHAGDVYYAPSARYDMQPAPNPILDVWSGFYLGANGGYGWNNDADAIITYNPPYSLTSLAPDISGAFGGGQIGYNWQRNHIVFGIEADFEAADIGGSVSGSAVATDGTTVAYTNRQNIDFFGSLRGRLGYNFGRSLIYVTGGFAYGDVSNEIEQPLNGAPYLTLKKSKLATGHTIGAGFEYALGRSWSIKGEYQHIDLENTVLSGKNICVCAATTFTSNEIDTEIDTVRIGVNYRFKDTVFNQGYEPMK